MEALCRIRDIFRSINDFEIHFQSKYSIGLNEGMLLCTISKFEKCSSGEIAEILGLSSSNSSKVIASVEKKGFIKRKIGKDNKRKMYFTLTEKGIECLKFIKCDSDDVLRIIDKIREI